MLVGGAGNDTLILNADVLANVALADVIADYQAGDVIDLSEMFTVSVANGGVADHFRMNGTALEVDVDGTAGGSTWQAVATVSGFVDNGVNSVSILYDDNVTGTDQSGNVT